MGGHVLRGYPQKKGHLMVSLYPGHVPRTVHSLVAETFLHRANEKHVVRHLDGNPANNRIENLAYGSVSDNLHDCYISYDGVVGSGKLHRADVVAIREALAQGETEQSIGKRFGVTKGTVSKIKLRKTYNYF